MNPCVYLKSVKQKNRKIDFVIIALYPMTFVFQQNRNAQEREVSIGKKI